MSVDENIFFKLLPSKWQWFDETSEKESQVEVSENLDEEKNWIPEPPVYETDGLVFHNKLENGLNIVNPDVGVAVGSQSGNPPNFEPSKFNNGLVCIMSNTDYIVWDNINTTIFQTADGIIPKATFEFVIRPQGWKIVNGQKVNTTISFTRNTLFNIGNYQIPSYITDLYIDSWNSAGFTSYISLRENTSQLSKASTYKHIDVTDNLNVAEGEDMHVSVIFDKYGIDNGTNIYQVRINNEVILSLDKTLGAYDLYISNFSTRMQFGPIGGTFGYTQGLSAIVDNFKIWDNGKFDFPNTTTDNEDGLILVPSPTLPKVTQGQLQRMLRLPGNEAKHIYEKVSGIEKFFNMNEIEDEQSIDLWLESLEWNWYGLSATLESKKTILGLIFEMNQRRGRYRVFEFVCKYLLNWTFTTRRGYERVCLFNEAEHKFFDSTNTTKNELIGSVDDQQHYFIKPGLFDAGQLKLVYIQDDSVEVRAEKLEILKQIVEDWLPFGMKFTYVAVQDLVLFYDIITDLNSWDVHNGTWSANAVDNFIEFKYDMGESPL